MQSYPTSITINGADFKIEYVGTQKEVDNDMEIETYWGSVSYEEYVIRIWAGQQPISILDTLLHETLHAIFNANRLLMSAIGNTKTEEAFITALASQLADTLVRSGVISLPEKQPVLTQRSNDD